LPYRYGYCYEGYTHRDQVNYTATHGTPPSLMER